jgi:transcription antitermination factor NusG
MGPTVRELCLNSPGLNSPGPNSTCSNSPGLNNEVAPWFALTVKHQHERSVEGALAWSGMDTFLPLYRSRRRWSDRSMEVDAPLFPGYVFGRFALGDRVRVLRTPGVARIVGFGGMPAAVAEGEIDGIRAALASKLPIGPWPYPKPGDRVRIESGPLRGLEGALVRQKDALRLVLSIELLQRSLAIEVAAETISPLRL